MIRIIDGVAYQGKLGSGFNVKAHDLGNGHMELTASSPTVWEELQWSRQQVEDHLEVVARYREEHPDEVRERSLKVAANRAKTRIRRLCKAMGANQLLTLTYRANEQDLQRVKADLKEFVRRLRRKGMLPHFEAVAAFEKQERGAYHVHMATCKVPHYFERINSTGQTYRVKSFDAIRAVWRSVTKEREGTINLAKRKANSQRSPAKIASYIAKYVTKAFAEGERWSNRWTKFGTVDTPEATDMGHVASKAEAVALMYWMLPEDKRVEQHFSRFGDWFYLSAEDETRRRK